jgi:hypothetical protein
MRIRLRMITQLDEATTSTRFFRGYHGSPRLLIADENVQSNSFSKLYQPRRLDAICLTTPKKTARASEETIARAIEEERG